MRRALITAALVFAAPATASAAPFGELPPRTLSGTATCLRATGAPGELVHLAGDAAVFLQAGPAGVAPVASLAAREAGCPQVAARPSGAGVYALFAESGNGVRAYVREAGGGWGSPVDVLTPPAGSLPMALAVTASDRGDALVAAAVRNERRTVRILVSRRAPGGGFGPAQTLLSRVANEFGAVAVRAGLSAQGEAVVAWAAQAKAGGPRELWVALAAPGAAFGAPQKVGELRPGSPFELAVADDGRALLAFPAADGLNVAEREPGAAFGGPVRLVAAADPFTVLPVVALRADGAAVVGWTGYLRPGVTVLSRTRPGPFGAPVVLGGRVPFGLTGYDPLSFSVITHFALEYGIEYGVTTGPGPDEQGGNLRAAFAGDGRVLLTWATAQRRDGVWWIAPRSALFSLATGAGEVTTHGAELREANAVTPLLLAGGQAGVAWTNNSSPASRGRLHVAVEGATEGADPAPPRVRVGPPASRSLRETASLVLPVTCSAACDVRAQVAGHGFEDSGELSLRAAGSGRLRLTPAVRPIARLDGGPVRVLVRYGAPGARHAISRSVQLRLRRVRVAPIRVLGLTARRDGDAIVVRWRTARPAGTDAFEAFGLAAKGDTTPRTYGDIGSSVPAARKTRFSLRLRDTAGVRWVTLLSESEPAFRAKHWTVRVTG